MKPSLFQVTVSPTATVRGVGEYSKFAIATERVAATAAGAPANNPISRPVVASDDAV
jgi:hypothetical protein